MGDFGSRLDDVILLGKCDDVVKDLARELGWDKELWEMWQETRMDQAEKADGSREGDGEEEKESTEEGQDAKQSKDDGVKDVLEKLTENMANQLSLQEEERTKAETGVEVVPKVDVQPEPEATTISSDSGTSSDVVDVVQGEKLPDEIVEKVEQATEENTTDEALEGKALAAALEEKA